MAISTVAILGLFFGTIGTTLGGLIGIFSKRNSNRFLSFVLAFASGLMLAVICFDLIPEAIEISSIYTTILGIILGIIIMVLCDNIVKNIFNKKENEFSHNVSSSSLVKFCLLISLLLIRYNSLSLFTRISIAHGKL